MSIKTYITVVAVAWAAFAAGVLTPSHHRVAHHRPACEARR